MQDHFDQPPFLVFQQFEALLLKALKGTSSKLEFVKGKYGDDANVNGLIVELSIFKALFKDKNIEHFHNIIKEVKLIDNAERKLIVNICTVCKISAVNPASNFAA